MRVLSRCRLLSLATPTPAAVAHLLVTRDGIDPALATEAARAAQGHVGRARVLARDESARARRREILLIPFGLTSLSACLGAAARLVEMCSAEATAATGLVDAREKAAALARMAGAGLGAVQSVAEGGAGDAPGPMPKLAMARDSGGAIEPGESTVTTTVTVVWELA